MVAARSDEALLLVGHGAAHFDNAGDILHAHADVLRGGGHFAQVAVGLLNGTPTVADALAELTATVVHIVPFFMEQGWFVRNMVPAAVGAPAGHVLRFHPPVGVHPDMEALAEARVLLACGVRASAFRVLLVGHGSARTPGRPKALHGHALQLVATGHFADARAAFLEESPFVSDALRDWRHDSVAVLGFFAGTGGHVLDDLPRLLRIERAQRPDAGSMLMDLGIIADDPAMPRIILEQATALD